jgi:hypothetical protein
MLHDLSEETVKEMHALFLDYYQNADYKTFKHDLSQKTGSFLWQERDTGKIIGFLNMKLLELPYKDRMNYIFFIGDTVLHRDYWQRNNSGNSPMAGTIYWFVIKLFLRHPFNLYWFMLSMSFRTYLVIANNMPNHYPHYHRKDKKIQHLKKLCNLVGKQMYGNKYNPESNLVDFGRKDQNQTIKSNVAPVTMEMLNKYPKIRYYESINPDNKKGIELACIGKIDWRAVNTYFKKFILRLTKSFSPQSKARKISKSSLHCQSSNATEEIV